MWKNAHYDLQEPKERLKLMHHQSTAKLLLLHQDMNWPWTGNGVCQYTRLHNLKSDHILAQQKEETAGECVMSRTGCATLFNPLYSTVLVPAVNSFLELHTKHLMAHLLRTVSPRSPTRSLWGPVSTEFQFQECGDPQLVNPSWCLAVRTTYLQRRQCVCLINSMCDYDSV